MVFGFIETGYLSTVCILWMLFFSVFHPLFSPYAFVLMDLSFFFLSFQSITIENAAYVCAVADQHEATNLRTFCIRFIVHNFLGVLETEGFQEMLLRRERLPLVLDILQQLGAESSATATALRHKRPRLSP